MIPLYAMLRSNPALVSLVGTRIYRSWAGDNAIAPYVVWTVVATPPDNHMSGRPPSDRYSVTVDCFARNEAESDALMKACRDAAETYGQLSSGPQDLGRDLDSTLWRWTFTVDISRNR